MNALNEWLKFTDSHLGGSVWFVYFLLGTGLFFTLYLRFPQFRFFGHALRTVWGRYDRKGSKGDTSHFGALATALSGTVGTGNIAGVAYALHLGGAAALFWMVVTAALGMVLKFVEVTVSHKYREFAKDGTVAGGPMYYMKNATFSLFGKPVRMMPLAVMFAVAMVISSLGSGNLPQVNSIANAAYTTFGVEKWLLGAVLGVFLFMVVVGGIKRIATITSKLVPFMATLYFFGALIVIFSHAENIIPSFVSIFSEIFTGAAATGGFLGATLSFTFQKGVGRGLFSNEAGQGSSPIAHAAARAEQPAAEGMVSILEPFIDTIIICMLTGLTILSTNTWKEKHTNVFQQSEVVFLKRAYDENKEEDREEVFRYLTERTPIGKYSGTLEVVEGGIQRELSILHARSLAEDVRVEKAGAPYTGTLLIEEGILQEKGISLVGRSLVHSAPLTTIAFQKSFMGAFGGYLVTFALLLFAFSTCISWSYYGDRAMTFLFGVRSVMLYRVLYVGVFVLGAFMDTALVWTFSNIAVALTTLPNLIGILWLRKQMPRAIRAYGKYFKEKFPDKSHPKFE